MKIRSIHRLARAAMFALLVAGIAFAQEAAAPNPKVAERAAEEALTSALAAREATVARREQIVLEDVSRALARASERGPRAADESD